MMLLATIQHSGTMQAIKVLGRSTCPLEERGRAKPDDLLFAHLQDERVSDILAFDGMIVTTERPVKDIQASWERRGKDLSELTRQFLNYESLLSLSPYVLRLGRWR